MSEKSYQSLKASFDGIICINSKFYCVHCKDNNSLSNEDSWAKGVQILDSGDSRKAYKALHKKATKHFTSKAHREVAERKKLAEKNILPKMVSNNLIQQFSATEKLLRIAYFIALNDRPYKDYPKIVELLECYGIILGRSSKDEKTCMRMIECIANQMRQKFVNGLLNSGEKFSLIVDESDNIAKDCCLIIYVKSFLFGKPITMFLDIIKLFKRDSESICDQILSTLAKHGLNDTVVKSRLIQFVSDGASTFVGANSSVSTILKSKIPNLIIWHCLAHRLELSVNDVRKQHTSIDQFQQTFKKIYKFYSKSSKNVSQIEKISKSLGTQFKKIGKLFTIRWSASSHQAVKAILHNFKALCKHFERRDRSIYLKLIDANFVRTLIVLNNALAEISILSKQLQARNITIVDAHKLIILCAKKLKVLAFAEIEELKEIENEKKFCGIKLVDCNPSSRLDKEAFFKDLYQEIMKRSMATVYTKNSKKEVKEENHAAFVEIFGFLNLLKKNKSNNEFTMCDRAKIQKAANFFSLDSTKLLHDFEIYKNIDDHDMKDLPELMKLHKISQSISVSSADAERGFSKMNLIMTNRRNRLKICNLSALMFISNLKMPIDQFNPKLYVEKWLQTHNSADSEINTNRKKGQDDTDESFFRLF